MSRPLRERSTQDQQGVASSATDASLELTLEAHETVEHEDIVRDREKHFPFDSTVCEIQSVSLPFRRSLTIPG